MSSIRLEIVPDPELFPSSGPAVSQLLVAMAQLTSLLRVGLLSVDEMRAQLGL